MVRLKAAKDNFIKRTLAVKRLMKEQDWQLFIWVIRLADVAMHLAGMDEIEEAYRIVDERLGDIFKQIPEDVAVLIASDHGLRKVEYNFNVNTFLKKRGYLEFSGGSPHLALASLGMKLGLKPLLVAGYRFLSKFSRKASIFDPEALSVDIEWSKTQAFTLTDTTSHFLGIWLNTRRAFDKGVVADGEEELLLGRIIHDLMAFRDKGKPVVKKVWTKQELYPGSGRYLPDLFVETSDGYAPDFRAYDKVITPNPKYIHDPYGIFIASGPQIKEGISLKDLEITDIAATLLHIFGQGLPVDIKGSVAKDIFLPDSDLFKKRIEHLKNRGEVKRRKDIPEEEIIRKRLRTLGYLG